MTTTPEVPLKNRISLNTLEVIHARRSVRRYTAEPVAKSLVHTLLNCATHAPTAMHQEPWAFAVIQDANVLDRLSDTAKALMDSKRLHNLHLIENPGFHVFYNAGTLIVIYGKFTGPFVEADCWLAAENLGLAAYSEGLGSCIIGFAVPALNTPEWKLELSNPEGMTAIAPIIVGVPMEESTPPVPRKPAEILSWL